MGVRIATNLASLWAQNSLKLTENEQAKTFQRLSSGQRIESAGTDPAGLAMSERMRAYIRSYRQDERNANDGISLVQTAEGGLTEIGNILIRIRELAIQAASDTVNDRDRALINQETCTLISEIDRISESVSFNDKPLLNGKTPNNALDIQVGLHGSAENYVQLDMNKLKATADELGISDLKMGTVAEARDSLELIDGSLTKVLDKRSTLGSFQNVMQESSALVNLTKENLTDARSRIADTDFAEETSKMTQENILRQAGVSVLAQANSEPMQVLKLI